MNSKPFSEIIEEYHQAARARVGADGMRFMDEFWNKEQTAASERSAYWDEVKDIQGEGEKLQRIFELWLSRNPSPL